MKAKFNIGAPLLKTLLKEYRHSIRENIQADLDVLPSMVNGDKIHTLTDEYVVISNMIKDIELCLAAEYMIVPIFVDHAIEPVGLAPDPRDRPHMPCSPAPIAHPNLANSPFC